MSVTFWFSILLFVAPPEAMSSSEKCWYCGVRDACSPSTPPVELECTPKNPTGICFIIALNGSPTMQHCTNPEFMKTLGVPIGDCADVPGTTLESAWKSLEGIDRSQGQVDHSNKTYRICACSDDMCNDDIGAFPKKTSAKANADANTVFKVLLTLPLLPLMMATR